MDMYLLYVYVCIYVCITYIQNIIQSLVIYSLYRKFTIKPTWSFLERNNFLAITLHMMGGIPLNI